MPLCNTTRWRGSAGTSCTAKIVRCTTCGHVGCNSSDCANGVRSNNRCRGCGTYGNSWNQYQEVGARPAGELPPIAKMIGRYWLGAIKEDPAENVPEASTPPAPEQLMPVLQSKYGISKEEVELLAEPNREAFLAALLKQGRKSRGLAFLLWMLSGCGALGFQRLYMGTFLRWLPLLGLAFAGAMVSDYNQPLALLLTTPALVFGMTDLYFSVFRVGRLNRARSLALLARFGAAVNVPPAAPRLNKKLIAAGLAGLAALSIAAAFLGKPEMKAKDTIPAPETAVKVPEVSPLPQTSPPVEPSAVHAMEVQAFIAPEVRISGLEAPVLQEAAQQGLRKRRIEPIADNKVLDGPEDWFSIRIFPAPAETTRLTLEMSVRNGASANNQIVRWENSRMLDAAATGQEVLAALDALLDDLAAAYNSDEYRAGKPAVDVPN